MATFSIGDAIGSGFGLIRRRPLSVWAWGLTYLILAGLPAMAVFGWMAPDYFSFLHRVLSNPAGAGDPPDPALFMPMQMKAMMLQPVMFVGSLVGRAVLVAAVFRAVLEPRNKAFASMRLGAQELWLGLLMLAIGILAVVLIVVVAIVAVAIGLGGAAGLKAAQVGTGWIVFGEVVLGMVACGVAIWVATRFSLAAPMTFADKEFRLFESWRVTKGHAWKLFFMAILLALVLGVMLMVVECLLIAVIAMTVGLGHFDPSRFEDFFKQPTGVWLQAVAPWVVAVLAIGSFLVGAVSTIAIAPWAAAYRALSGGGAVAGPAVFGPEPVAPPQVAHAVPAAPEPAPGHHADEGHAAEDGHGDDHGDGQDHHGH